MLGGTLLDNCLLKTTPNFWASMISITTVPLLFSLFLQVNNLPIRSPKVQTLKKALKKFHHTQKGRNVKKVGTKSSPGTLLREDRDGE